MSGLPPLSERGPAFSPRKGRLPSPPQRNLKDIREAIGHPYFFGNGLNLIHRDKRHPEASLGEDLGFQLAVRREGPLGRFVLGGGYIDSIRSLAQTSKPDAVSFEITDIPDPDDPSKPMSQWTGVVMYDVRSMRMQAEPKKRFEGARDFIDKFPEATPEVLEDLGKLLPGRIKPPLKIEMKPINQVSFYIVLPRIVEGPIELPFDVPFREFAYLHYQMAA